MTPEERIIRDVQVRPSGDASGRADTRTFNEALRSLESHPGTLRLDAGTFCVRAGETSPLGPGQSLVGAGSAQTIIEAVGSGAALRAFDPAPWVSFSSAVGGPRAAGAFTGFTVDGANADPHAVGMHVGDLLGLDTRDVRIQNFDAPGSVGLLMDCVVTWAERGGMEVELLNNADNVVFDSHISGESYTRASYGYSRYSFIITAYANQNGVTVRSGVAFVGCDLTVRGNFICGEANHGVAFAVGNADGIGSHISASTLNWQVETNGGPAPHRSLSVADSSGVGNCQGVLNFLAGNGIPFADAVVTGALSFTGTVLCPGLGSMAWPQASRNLGAVTGTGTSSSMPVWPSAGNYVWILLQPGDAMFAWGEDAHEMEGQAGTWELILQQPPEDGPATLTWPNEWIWADGGPPSLSRVGGAVDRVRVVTPDFRRFFAEHIGASPNRPAGVVTLSRGSAGVADARVTPRTVVRHSRQAALGALGELSIELASGRGFVVRSSSRTEASLILWEILSY